MKRSLRRLFKGTMFAGMMAVYQAPGCSLNVDDATLQSLLDTLNGLENVNIEFTVNGGGRRNGHHDMDMDDEFEDESEDDES